MKTTLDTMKLKVTGNPNICDVMDALIEKNPSIKLINKETVSEEVELYVLEFSKVDYEEVLKIVKGQSVSSLSGQNYFFYSVEFTDENPNKPIKPARKRAA